MPNKKEKDDNILNDFDELDNDLQQETVEEDQLQSVPEPKDDFKEDVLKENFEKEELKKQSHDEDMNESIFDTTSNISVNVKAVIGRANVTIRELLEYKNGTVIDLHRSPGETVDIVVGERLVARGELVDMDGKLGVRILKVLR